MLVDTDVLIWHLRGYAQATLRLDQLPDFATASGAPELLSCVGRLAHIDGPRVEHL